MDNTLDILEIENHIHKLLHSSNGVTVHFRFKGRELSLFTFNQTNNEFFLVKTITVSGAEIGGNADSVDFIEMLAYKNMLVYVDELVHSIDKNKWYPSIGSSYTVIWSREGKTNTSYFYGRDIEEVLEKFFYGKEGIKHLFNILEIKQNPIS